MCGVGIKCRSKNAQTRSAPANGRDALGKDGKQRSPPPTRVSHCIRTESEGRPAMAIKDCVIRFGLPQWTGVIIVANPLTQNCSQMFLARGESHAKLPKSKANYSPCCG